MLYNSIEETIGNTPLIRLHRIEEHFGLKTEIYAKLEYFNPGASIKDRPAINMLDEAYKNGKIREGFTIVEPTSGNTGIGLALAACKYNLNVILTMPESVSAERVAMMKALGAKTILTDKKLGMKGSIKKAEEILETTSDSFMPMQFSNSANPDAHFHNTAREILLDLKKEPEIFIAGVGTGGTVTGCGRYFKRNNLRTKVYAVEPFESSVLSGKEPGKHGIQGIGAGFIPDILDTDVIEKIIRINTEEAAEKARKLVKIEKITGGISAGAALAAAIIVSKESNVSEIVFVVPDTTERYLSTGIFD